MIHLEYLILGLGGGVQYWGEDVISTRLVIPGLLGGLLS